MKAVLNQISRSYLDDIAHPNPIRTRKRAMGPDWIAAKKGGDTGDTAECTKMRRITSVTRASFAASRRASIGIHANPIWRSGAFICMFIFNLMSERAESLEMDLGGYHSCALLPTGKVMCWGSNGDGQLGDGTYTQRVRPVEVPGISTATSIGLGGYHSCALLMSGKVMCWGYNNHGQLGDGTPNPEQLVPVEVSGISTATSISAGFDHSCAILADGKVMCWGHNPWGGLGDGTTTDSAIPVQVSANFFPTSIAVGRGHACALLNGGKVMCWGSSGNGQLGDGTTTNHLTPVEVSGITSATKLSLGDYHSCAMLVDGKVVCWGYNGDGQLGDGTYADRTGPVEVLGISTATSISLGGYHSCAVLADGKVMCWGSNRYGTLGDGTATVNRTTPANVLGISTATTIAHKQGQYHSCAVLTGHKVMCWGRNCNGQLGDGSTMDDIPRYAPVDVSGLPTLLPSCRWVCTSINNDCCAPGDEEATCSGDFVPIYTGNTCGGYDGDYRCCNPGTVGGSCNSTKCTSINEDCCAPGDEIATCSDGYAPIYTGLGCSGFDDGDYMCCTVPDAKSESFDEDFWLQVLAGVVAIVIVCYVYRRCRQAERNGDVGCFRSNDIEFAAFAAPGQHHQHHGTESQYVPASANVGAMRKEALVVGVKNYANSPLTNTLNDAKDVAAKLKRMGFRVELSLDPTLNDFDRAQDRFDSRIGPGVIALFYFSGHGCQSEGDNFLCMRETPDGVYEDKLERTAARLNKIIERTRKRRAAFTVAITDACRNNRVTRLSRDAPRGLAEWKRGFAIEDAGVVVAYSTAPGTSASDGTGNGDRNGFYTHHLLKFLDRKAPVRDVLESVSIHIKKVTHDEQEPWVNSHMGSDIARKIQLAGLNEFF